MKQGKNNIPIKYWAEEDQPREKLIDRGPDYLSTAELLAILLRSGNQDQSALNLGRQILRDVGEDLEELSQLNVHELMNYKGIGKAKAVSIVAALELGRRRSNTTRKSLETLNSSWAIYEYIASKLIDKNIEECWIIYFRKSLSVIGHECISRGGQSSTIIDPKVVFKKSLDRKAAFIALIHNHPSNNLTPSSEDIKITKKLAQVGKDLSLPLIDHLIVGQSGYYSFRDEGLLD